MLIRRLSEAELTEGEETLLAGLSSGDIVPIGGTDRPEPDAGPDRQIRAAILRYLLLGGCDELGARGVRLHEKGVQFRGALVTGHLDLQGCRIPRDFAVLACRFETAPNLRNAILQSVSLNGSSLPGLAAGGVQAGGGVFLRGVETAGEVRLPAARLGGSLDCLGAILTGREGEDALYADGLDAKVSVVLQAAIVSGEVRLLGVTLGRDLDCVGASLRAQENGRALNADGLNANGSVFLRSALVAGEVRLPGASLGGNLDCADATLTTGKRGYALSADGLEARGGVYFNNAIVSGGARMTGATLGGNFECDGATLTASEGLDAIRLDAARIVGGWFWRDGARAEGFLDLQAATIGSIADDPACWPQEGQGGFLLDRCQYGAFLGGGVSADDRKTWLLRQRAEMIDGPDFRPQPWEQCAKVLREMGHADDARQILIEKERRQRAGKAARLDRDGHAWRARFIRSWDWLLGWTVRYGQRPLRAFVFLAAFLAFGTGVFGLAAWSDDVKPNVAFVLRSPEWVLCSRPSDNRRFIPSLGEIRTGLAREGESQRDCYERQDEAGTYPRFNALIYSADTLLPIVSLEMQEYWIPDDRAWPVGTLARVYLWVHIAAGWALSLLAVAGFSGLVKSD